MTFLPTNSRYRLVLDQMERTFLETQLTERRWNRKRTARDLGICYRTLLYKIARLNLQPPKTNPQSGDFPLSRSALERWLTE